MSEDSGRVDTKQKLASIIDGFSSFDSEMKMGTRQRREKDEQRLSELKTEIIKIDKALSAEMKRGLERNKAIQHWADEQVDTMHKSFSTKLDERTEDAKVRVETLNTRIGEIRRIFSYRKRKNSRRY